MAVYLPLEKTDKIFSQMERSKARFWWVMDSDKTLISEYESEDGTYEDSYNALMDVINDLEGDYVFVIIRNKIPNKDENTGDYKRGANIKGIQKFEYRVKLKGGGSSSGGRINGFGGNDSMGAIMGLYNEMGTLRAELVRTEKDAQIKALEEKLKDGAAGSVTNQLIQSLTQEVVNFLKLKNGMAIGPAATPVTGTATPPAEGKPLTEDEKKDAAANLSANMKKVTGVMGADFYKLFEALAVQADKSPENFKAQAAAIITASGVK